MAANVTRLPNPGFYQEVLADSREISLQLTRNVFECSLRVEAAFGDFQRLAANIPSDDVDIPAAAITVHRLTDGNSDRYAAIP